MNKFQQVIFISIIFIFGGDSALAEFKPYRIFHLDNSPIFAIAFSMDTSKALIGGSYPSNKFLLWDIATGEIVQERNTKGVPVSHAAFSPDGRHFSTGYENFVEIWDINDSSYSNKIRLVEMGDTAYHPIHTLAFTPDGNRLVVGISPNAKVIDVAMGKEIKTLLTGSGPKKISFIDNQKVLFGFGNRTEVWDLTTEMLIEKFDNKFGGFLSRDKKKLFSHYDSAVGSRVEILNWDSKTPDQMIQAPINNVADASYDGSLILSIGGSNNAFFANLKTQATQVFQYEEPVTDAKFSPDDRYILIEAGTKAYLYEVAALQSAIPNAMDIGESGKQ